MSVINKMLQEIEERHDETAQKNMPGVVRAVAVPGARIPWRTIGLGAAALVGIGAVVFILWQVTSSRKVPPKPAAPAPVVAVAPTPISPPPVVADVPPPDAAPAVEAPRLQASTTLFDPAPSAPAVEVAEKPSVKPAPLPKSDAPNPLLRARDDVAAEKTEASARLKPAGGVKPGTASEKPADMKHTSPAQRVDNRYREALSLIAQGRQAEAQTALEEVLQLDPRNLNARQILLALHVENKRYTAAEKVLRDGLNLNLAPATYAVTLARIQVEQGDQAGALATLDNYAQQAGGQVDYLGFHAALLQRANRHAEAIKKFQSALKLRPSQASWWLALGISLQAEKRNAEAAQAYQQAHDNPALAPELRVLAEQRMKQVRDSQ